MRFGFVCLCSLLASTSAHADVELKNDGFVSGGTATFQTGFIAEEAGAVRFVAPAADRKLLRIDMLFGGAATTETMTLKIFDDTAGTDEPGTLLFMGDFEMTGSDSAMHALDISSANIVVPQQFRVAIVFHHAGVPTIASDADGIAADLNYILAATIGWRKSNALQVAGDWIIRATVTDGSSGPTKTFCDIDEECLLGDFCDVDHHACIHDCRSNSDCPNSGSTCSDRGQCSGGTPPADDDGCRTTHGPHGLAIGLAIAGLLAVSRRRRRGR